MCETGGSGDVDSTVSANRHVMDIPYGFQTAFAQNSPFFLVLLFLFCSILHYIIIYHTIYHNTKRLSTPV